MTCVCFVRPWRKPWPRTTKSFVSSSMVFPATPTTLRAGTKKWTGRQTWSLCFSLTAAMRCVTQFKHRPDFGTLHSWPCLWSAPPLSTGLHSEVFRQGEGKWANRRQQRKPGKKVNTNSPNPLCSCRMYFINVTYWQTDIIDLSEPVSWWWNNYVCVIFSFDLRRVCLESRDSFWPCLLSCLSAEFKHTSIPQHQSLNSIRKREKYAL